MVNYLVLSVKDLMEVIIGWEFGRDLTLKKGF
jgi:hypothetical protein